TERERERERERESARESEREQERERERRRQTERQTDKQTDRQTDRHTERVREIKCDAMGRRRRAQRRGWAVVKRKTSDAPGPRSVHNPAPLRHSHLHESMN
ncbi:hypothetical protein T484DRAFT_1615755, partial [Baffinella frigidus]